MKRTTEFWKNKYEELKSELDNRVQENKEIKQLKKELEKIEGKLTDEQREHNKTKSQLKTANDAKITAEKALNKAQDKLKIWTDKFDITPEKVKEKLDDYELVVAERDDRPNITKSEHTRMQKKLGELENENVKLKAQIQIPPK